MKRLLVFVAIAVFPLALVAQTSHFKVNQSGAFASASLNPDQFTEINMSVSRDTNNTVTTTDLTFFDVVFAQDFSTLTLVQVFGPIPDSAFSGDNTQNLNLNLDLSTLDPTVTFIQTCTIDLNTFNTVCSSTPPTGVIQLSFQGNGFQRTQVITSETVNTFGPTTVRTHSRSDTTSAKVSGSVLGVSFTGGSGTIGVNHNSTLEATRI